MSFYNFSVHDSVMLKAESVVTHDNYIVYASVIGYPSQINEFNSELKKKTHVTVYGACGYANLYTQSQYQIIKNRDSDTDMCHEIIYKKDNCEGDYIKTYIFYRNDEEKYDCLYNKICEYTDIPFLPEWSQYIYDTLFRHEQLRKLNRWNIYYDHDKYPEQPFMCDYLYIHKDTFKEYISKGIKDQEISIGNKFETSSKLAAVTGLDSYLNSYSEILANKIQQSFIPKYIPGNNYDQKLNNFDNALFADGIDLYSAQKSAIQATVNNLKVNDVSFMIGEQGSGKTLMSAASCYCHSKKDGFNAFVMCPSHLVNKWKREVENYIPNGKGYIVKTLSDLKRIESIIKNKFKIENVFVIISKENAKLDMEYRPAAIWSNRRNCFVCPDCGQPLYEKPTQKEEKDWRYTPKYLKEDSFLKENTDNRTCCNRIRIWDRKNRRYDTKTCGCKLWVPVSDNNNGWIKIGAEGWYHESHLQKEYDRLMTIEHRNRKEDQLLAKLSLVINDSNSKSVAHNLKKYPIAKYIHKYYKPFVDYFIADEIHLLKGKSEQGEAFAALSSVAKKTLGLTGTLLNGYADGLFYILYRTLPDLMKKEGFNYNNVDAFTRTFGVVKKITKETASSNRYQRSQITSSEKKLPGVSPLVFTKFLLEHAVFINLSDMSEGLPDYSEHPIGIPMDNILRSNYETLEQSYRTALGRKDGYKLLGSFGQVLSAFPDMPYDMLPVIHPVSGEICIIPPNIGNELRNKENALLNLIRDKVNNQHEKVLIYYQWVNITDIADRFLTILNEEGIKTAVLNSSVSSEKREEWINQKLEDGIDVLICNPALVETGLDLLAFTNIIFYETGYNTFTVRQASRRSWRLGQEHPVNVYFIYYEDTIQEQALSLMATKIQASMAIEGKFSEEGLRALSDNEDLLTKIADSIVNGIKNTVNADSFKSITNENFNKENLYGKFIYITKYDLENHETINYWDSAQENKNEILNNRIQIINIA